MFRIIVFLLFATVVMILSLPFALITACTLGSGIRKTVHPVPKWIAAHPVKWAAAICGIKCDRRGEENIPDGPALYVCNHQGIADILLSITQLGDVKSFVAKKEAEKIPLIHFWMKSFDCVFIDRSDPREGLKAINRAAELLEAGRSVIIYPEGTRSRGPEMGEFKHGALKCAVKAGVPVIPVAYDNSYAIYEATGRIHPGTVKMAILPPVSTEGRKTAELADEVQQIMQAQLDAFRKE